MASYPPRIMEASKGTNDPSDGKWERTFGKRCGVCKHFPGNGRHCAVRDWDDVEESTPGCVAGFERDAD